MKTTKIMEVDLSVKDLAELFACLGSDEQAQFFEEVELYAESNFEKGRFGMQMQWCSLARDATKAQKEAILSITSSVWLHTSNYLRQQPSGDW